MQIKRFALLEIAYWCSYGAFTSFALRFLSDSGISAASLGTAAAMFTVGAILGQLFWSAICDKTNSNKRIYIFTNILLLLVYIMIYFMPKTTVLVIFAYFFLGAIQGPMAANLDTWILKELGKEPQKFGPIRSWASLAYAVFVLFFGWVLSQIGYYIMIVFGTFFIILSVVTALFTKEQRIRDRHKTAEVQHTQSESLRSIIKPLSLLAGAFFIMGVSSAPIMQMIALLTKSYGGDVSLQGIVMFTSNVSQVPLMLLYPKFKRLKTQQKISVAAGLYLVSGLVLGSFSSQTGLLVGCAVNGLAYGMFLPSMRKAALEISTVHTITRVQGICDSSFSAVGATFSNLISGLFLQYADVRIFLLGCGLAQLIPIALLTLCSSFVFATKTQENKKLSNG